MPLEVKSQAVDFTSVSNLSRRTAMRELTDVELDAVSGGFLNHATGNGGIGANIFQKNTARQHAEVEDAHDVVLVQAVSQSNSSTISNTKNSSDS
jgi:hypothetical protein